MLFADAETRVMSAKKKGMKAYYNIPTATDKETSLIVGFATTNASNDMGKLYGAAQKVKENWRRGP